MIGTVDRGRYQCVSSGANPEGLEPSLDAGPLSEVKFLRIFFIFIFLSSLSLPLSPSMWTLGVYSAKQDILYPSLDRTLPENPRQLFDSARSFKDMHRPVYAIEKQVQMHVSRCDPSYFTSSTNLSQNFTMVDCLGYDMHNLTSLLRDPLSHKAFHPLPMLIPSCDTGMAPRPDDRSTQQPRPTRPAKFFPASKYVSQTIAPHHLWHL